MMNEQTFEQGWKEDSLGCLDRMRNSRTERDMEKERERGESGRKCKSKRMEERVKIRKEWREASVDS